MADFFECCSWVNAIFYFFELTLVSECQIFVQVRWMIKSKINFYSLYNNQSQSSNPSKSGYGEGLFWVECWTAQRLMCQPTFKSLISYKNKTGGSLPSVLILFLFKVLFTPKHIYLIQASQNDITSKTVAPACLPTGSSRQHYCCQKFVHHNHPYNCKKKHQEYTSLIS